MEEKFVAKVKCINEYRTEEVKQCADAMLPLYKKIYYEMMKCVLNKTCTNNSELQHKIAEMHPEVCPVCITILTEDILNKIEEGLL